MTPITHLRHLMKKRGVQGVLVPMTDPFHNEYPPQAFQRIRDLTGFTGSYGTALVLEKTAALFIDGRYTTQAQTETDAAFFEILPYGWPTLKQWLAQHHPAKKRIAYDPWTFTCRDLIVLETIATSLGCTFVPSPSNDVDAIRPLIEPLPATPVFNYDIAYAGESAAAKIDKMVKILKEHAIDHFLFFDPASLCWLLNIRGNDTPYTPLTFCYGMLSAKGHMSLFIDEQKMSPVVHKAIGAPVTLYPIEALGSWVRDLASTKIGYDPDTALSVLHEWMGKKSKNLVALKDPSLGLRAQKNATEISNAREAHLYDGVCLARFFTWLEVQWDKEPLTGYTITERLEAMRAESPAYRSLSFHGIVGVNAQSAQAHYRAEPNTALPLTPNSLLLIDSGSQYLEGTTDVTRMAFLGSCPSEKQKRVYTLVLKGLIALSQARFPQGTRGCQLDVLARMFLWQNGLDFSHSTGHGVGQYLNVHEGPQNISPRLNETALEVGMIVSNEPGCYFPGEWGVRIENLMVVIDTGEKDLLGRPLYAFDTLTLVPIAQPLIARSLMTAGEIEWLNEYHARVERTLQPQLGPNERTWLKRATHLIDT